MRKIDIVICGLALIAFANASPAPDASGIEGAIVVAPTHPGPIRKGEEPKTAPVANTQFVVKDRDDKTIATFMTDGDGRFKVSLPPGHYVVSMAGPPARVGRWSFEADVIAGQITKVNWTADSGMR